MRKIKFPESKDARAKILANLEIAYERTKAGVIAHKLPFYAKKDVTYYVQLPLPNINLIPGIDSGD